MEDYSAELSTLFEENANSERAKKQKAYMKERFSFFGITALERKRLQRPFLQKAFLPDKEKAFSLAKVLWDKPEREFHYFAMELLEKYQKQTEIDDIVFFEWLIENQPWWDTVDFIASHLVGNYFVLFPTQQERIIKQWLKSDSMWLQRTCLIYQLRYKESTIKNEGVINTEILSYCIENLIGSKEFFINKAIGWALRQYSRSNPEWVIRFVTKHPELDKLSKREALRLLS